MKTNGSFKNIAWIIILSLPWIFFFLIFGSPLIPE